MEDWEEPKGSNFEYYFNMADVMLVKSITLLMTLIDMILLG